MGAESRVVGIVVGLGDIAFGIAVAAAVGVQVVGLGGGVGLFAEVEEERADGGDGGGDDANVVFDGEPDYEICCWILVGAGVSGLGLL